MSKQLAISAAFSVFAMAAFALAATPDMPTGARTFVQAPAALSILAHPTD